MFLIIMACIRAWRTITFAVIPLSPALAKWIALQNQLQHWRATSQTHSPQDADILSGLSLRLAMFIKRFVELKENVALMTNDENERRDIMAEARRRVIQGMDKVIAEPADH